MNTNIEYDYQDIYDVSNYPHPINYTCGTYCPVYKRTIFFL